MTDHHEPTATQFSHEQEQGMSEARAAMRTLPEAMDRHAYLALDEHAKSLQLRLINYQRFIKDMGLESDLMLWCQRTETLL